MSAFDQQVHQLEEPMELGELAANATSPSIQFPSTANKTTFKRKRTKLGRRVVIGRGQIRGFGKKQEFNKRAIKAVLMKACAIRYAPSAYQFWFKDCCAGVVEIPGNHNGVAELSKKVGELWKAMNEEQRAPYVLKSLNAKEARMAHINRKKTNRELALKARKKPHNPVFAFINENRAMLTAQSPVSGFGNIAKYGAELFKALPIEEKEKLQQRYQDEKRAYDDWAATEEGQAILSAKREWAKEMREAAKAMHEGQGRCCHGRKSQVPKGQYETPRKRARSSLGKEGEALTTPARRHNQRTKERVTPAPPRRPTLISKQLVKPLWTCSCIAHLTRHPQCIANVQEQPPVVHLSNSTVIGRDETCDIILQSKLTPGMISRRHAVIHRESDGFTMTDLGSVNGILVNGKKVKGKEILSHGDAITFGVQTPHHEFDYEFEIRSA